VAYRSKIRKNSRVLPFYLKKIRSISERAGQSINERSYEL